MSQKILLIIVIILIILIVLVVIFINPKKQGSPTGNENNTLSGVEIAKEIFGFSGIIKEIGDKTLILEAAIPSADPTKALIKQTVKAIVTEQTKIARLNFLESSEVPADNQTAAQPTETKINFSDLKIGDKIDIATLTNISENIKNGTEITLKSIFITEK